MAIDTWPIPIGRVDAQNLKPRTSWNPKILAAFAVDINHRNSSMDHAIFDVCPEEQMLNSMPLTKDAGLWSAEAWSLKSGASAMAVAVIPCLFVSHRVSMLTSSGQPGSCASPAWPLPLWGWSVMPLGTFLSKLISQQCWHLPRQSSRMPKRRIKRHDPRKTQ